jgi:hypothetical protein
MMSAPARISLLLLAGALCLAAGAMGCGTEHRAMGRRVVKLEATPDDTMVYAGQGERRRELGPARELEVGYDYEVIAEEYGPALWISGVITTLAGSITLAPLFLMDEPDELQIILLASLGGSALFTGLMLTLVGLSQEGESLIYVKPDCESGLFEGYSCGWRQYSRIEVYEEEESGRYLSLLPPVMFTFEHERFGSTQVTWINETKIKVSQERKDQVIVEFTRPRAEARPVLLRREQEAPRDRRSRPSGPVRPRR